MASNIYKGNILELDGLRGVAILLVIFHHFWPSSGPFFNKYASVAHLGWVGVDLFFVISGVLIGGILLDTRQDAGYFKNFYARRVFRIFPLYYLLVVLVYLTVPLAQSVLHGVSWSGSDFVLQSGNPLWYMFFLGNVREAIVGVEPAYVLAPLWSISIEEQFYMLSPLLVLMLSRRHLFWVLLSFMFVAPLFRFVMFLEVPGNERIQYLATISRLDNLSAGVLLAVFMRSNFAVNQVLVRNALLVLSIVFVYIFERNGFDRHTMFCRVFGYSFLAVYFAVMVLWALSYRGTPWTSALRNPALMKLGELCFGTYLLQRPAEVALVKGLGKLGFDLEAVPWLSLSLKSLFAVLVGWLSWRYLESPINRLKARFKSEHHPMDGRLPHA